MLKFKPILFVLLVLLNFIGFAQAQPSCVADGGPPANITPPIINSVAASGRYATVNWTYMEDNVPGKTMIYITSDNSRSVVYDDNNGGRCGRDTIQSIDTGLGPDKQFIVQVCVHNTHMTTTLGSCSPGYAAVTGSDSPDNDPSDVECEQLASDDVPTITRAQVGAGYFEVVWNDNSDIEDGYRLEYARRAQYGGYPDVSERLYSADTTSSGRIETSLRGTIGVRLVVFNDCQDSALWTSRKTFSVTDPPIPPEPHWSESIEAPLHRRRPPTLESVVSGTSNGYVTGEINWVDRSHFEDGYFFLHREKGKNSGAFGGDGGTRFSVFCDDAKLLIGVAASYGNVVDSLVGICAKVKSDGTLHQISRTRKVGGDKGDEEIDLRCPNGSAIRHARVHHDDYVNKIDIRCRKINNIQANSGDLMVVGRGSGPSSSLTSCENGFASGLYGKDGSYVDALGLVCKDTFDWRIAEIQSKHSPRGYSGQISSAETTEFEGSLNTRITLQPYNRPDISMDYEVMVCGYGKDYRNPFGTRQIGSWPNLSQLELDYLNRSVSDGDVKGCSNVKLITYDG